MNTTTEKKRFTTRDVMVIAAMMVLTFAVYGAVGALTLPFPFRLPSGISCAHAETDSIAAAASPRSHIFNFLI